MKIIDLLNKIANGEYVPNRILYEGITYWYDEKEKDYYTMIAKDLDDEDIEYLCDCKVNLILNDEIEIIEEDKKKRKIRKIILDDLIDSDETIYDNFHEVELKINEIIDILNKGDNND